MSWPSAVSCAGAGRASSAAAASARAARLAWRRRGAGLRGKAAGTLLVGDKGEDRLSFINLSNGRELGRVPTARMPHEIAVWLDGRQAAVVAYGGTSIDLFDIASRTRLRSIELSPNAAPHGLVWLDDGRLVATPSAAAR